MREVDVSLDLMKKDYKSRMDECEDRRVLFEVKQAKMREQVLKFEKFIQENDAKRIRAEAKAKNERQLFAEKCKEMGTLKSRIDELDKLRDILVTELGELLSQIKMMTMSLMRLGCTLSKINYADNCECN